MDAVSDALFVVDCSWIPSLFVPALVFFLLSMFVNIGLVLVTMRAHLDTGRAARSPGLSAVLLMFSFTSPDVMALLPWERVVDANGFPSRSSYICAACFKYLEDVPLFIIQICYIRRFPERGNSTIYMSMVLSALSLVWQGLVRCFASIAVDSKSSRVLAGHV